MYLIKISLWEQKTLRIIKKIGFILSNQVEKLKINKFYEYSLYLGQDKLVNTRVYLRMSLRLLQHRYT